MTKSLRAIDIKPTGESVPSTSCDDTMWQAFVDSLTMFSDDFMENRNQPTLVAIKNCELTMEDYVQEPIKNPVHSVNPV